MFITDSNKNYSRAPNSNWEPVILLIVSVIYSEIEQIN